MARIEADGRRFKLHGLVAVQLGLRVLLGLRVRVTDDCLIVTHKVVNRPSETALTLLRVQLESHFRVRPWVRPRSGAATHGPCWRVQEPSPRPWPGIMSPAARTR